jgi:hypothetical protein
LSKEEADKMYKRKDGSTWFTTDDIFDERFFRFPRQLKR